MTTQRSDELHFESASASHQGRVRKYNEDSVYAGNEAGVWVVADGMGGHNNGNLASTMIVEAAARVQQAQSLESLAIAFRAEIDGVNSALAKMSNGDSGLLVGSTAVALLVHAEEFTCLWAGDSRCYLLRGGQLAQVSHDHTEVQDLVDTGAITPTEARTWPRRNVITRAVGADQDFHLDSARGRVDPGDCFILCSDGLTGHVEDGEIRDIASHSSARAACERLVALALERGGKDNVSVIVIKVSRREATVAVQRW
jgi:protein phosphatase